MDLIQIQNVSHQFRTGFWLKQFHALSNVTLNVPQGSIFGLLGPNGAGKTTLIHLVAGLRRPTAGRVTIAGFDAHSPEARACLGFLPERPYFHDHLTGQSFLEYMGLLSGLTSSELKARVPLVLERVGMSHARTRELKRFSKGMLQRIGIAQALLPNPQLLVLDEPMSGLDPVGRREIRELILSLSREGTTLLFSSHILSDVEALCTQIAVLQKGKLVEQGTIQSVVERRPAQIEVAFEGVSPERIEFPFIRVEKLARGWLGVTDTPQNAQRALAQVLENQGSVLWMTPERARLEEFFEREGQPS